MAVDNTWFTIQNIQKLVNMDLQLKNKLKFMLIPTKEGMNSISQIASGALSAVTENLVTTLYLQSITFPAGPNLEYDENTRRIKGMTTPDTVSLTFLEDEKGTVWKFIQGWRKSIVYVAPPAGEFLASATSVFFSSGTEYIFANNQEVSERIGILLLGSGNAKKKNGITGFPRIMLYGLKYKAMEEITVGYNESGNLTYTLSCSVREIGAPYL